MRQIVSVLVLVLVLIGLPACGDSDDGSGGPNTGGTGATSSGGTSSGGTGATSSGGTSSGGTGGTAVSVIESKDLPETLDLRIEAGTQGEGTGQVLFTNSYVYNIDASAGGRCAIEAVGEACFVRRCAGAGALNLLDLGTIHVTAGASSWDLTADTTKTYSTYSKKSAALAGLPFEVTTTGGDVVAFEVAGTLPPAPPAWASPVDETIVRGQPVPFVWTAADAQIEVGIYQTSGKAGTSSSAEIRCHADGNAGSFTIPGQATEKLAEGLSGVMTNYFYGAFKEYVVSAGGTNLSISAFSYIPRPASVN